MKLENEELNLIWACLNNANIPGNVAELMVETKKKLSAEIESRIEQDEWISQKAA